MMMAVFMTYKSKANIVTNDLYETFLNVGAISNITKALLNRNEMQVVVVLKKIKKNEKKKDSSDNISVKDPIAKQ